MKNVLEKILEELETLHNKILKDKFAERVTEQEIDSLIKAKDIIRSYMDEIENDGWIPVEERLPEFPEGLADEYCPEFNVTIKGAERTTTLKYSWDGTWFDDNGNVYNVIAWQPLPAPYKPNKDNSATEHIMSRFMKVE